jgi:CRP-like cAMP-binding protein
MLRNREQPICVLDIDPDLGANLPDAARPDAMRRSIARVLRVNEKTWDASAAADVARTGFGLLLIDGLILRRVGQGERFGGELLSSGDLLRPWEHDGEVAMAPFETRWTILSTPSFAILDGAWAAAMAPWPAVACALAGRGVQRSLRIAVMSAIMLERRIEQRLHMVLWELGQRQGRMRPEGILLSLPMTHQMLSELVAARRPSVTTGLQRLARTGKIRKHDGGWILLQAPGQKPDDHPADARRDAHVRQHPQ